jgi:hypothetical protein
MKLRIIAIAAVLCVAGCSHAWAGSTPPKLKDFPEVGLTCKAPADGQETYLYIDTKAGIIEWSDDLDTPGKVHPIKGSAILEDIWAFKQGIPGQYWVAFIYFGSDSQYKVHFRHAR